MIKKLVKYGENEHFRLLVEQVTEYAIFLLDPDGVISTWNPGAERIKGYAPDEIIGCHFSKFYRPEDVWKCEYELDVARREGRVEDEGWRVRKDGSLFWANVVITCLRDEDRQIIGYAKVTRDLTERRREEQKLRESEERFRLLIESVRDYAIFMLDAEGYVTTWNVGAQRIKGYEASEIIGKHFSSFYMEEDVRSGKCEMELEVATAEGRFEDEGWRVRKDGTRFWANVVITALFNPTTHKLMGFAKVTRDLTERRAAEEQRLRLGKLAQERVLALGELSEALAKASTTVEVATAVIDKGVKLAHADTCTLYLLDEQSKALELIAERGCNPEVLEHVRRIAADSGNPTCAVGTGAAPAAWIETFADYQRYFPALAGLSVQGERAHAFACVPLLAEDRILGMIGMGWRAERELTNDEREFIETGARQCAQALARARRLESERRAAAEVARLQASLSTTLRSIGDAVITTDRRGALTLMNAVAEQLTGWTELDARGRPISEVFRILNEHTRAPVASPVDKVLETGTIVGLANHTILIRRDGGEVPIDDSASPIRADNGEIEGVVLVFRDITARKREEAWRSYISEASSVLAESLDYDVTVAKVARLAIPRLADWCAVDVLIDGETKRITVAHQDPVRAALAAELHFKYPPDPSANMGVPHVLRTGRSEYYREITDDLLVRGCLDDEHLRIARGLGLRSVIVVPLIARDRILGAFTFAYAESDREYSEAEVGMAGDLARRCAHAIENARLYASEQSARKQADIANRAKDEFLAIVSHELRTPLNAIMGWARLLSEPDFEEHRRQRAVDTIERNSVAMAQLIEDLLDMSRVISGKMRLEVQQVNIVSVVDAAIESIRPAAAARSIELMPLLDPALPLITGDPTRLQQIVWNLLSNAVKFTPKGGRVTVLTDLVDSALQIVVSDSGKGIASSFLPYVFDAFRQEDASSSRARGGLGLGLAITKQLVELHGGSITATSAGENLGAKFCVQLPVAAVTSTFAALQAPKKQSRPPAREGSQLRGIHVLVVDDEEDARALVGTVLEDCGCRVSTAGSVQQALEQIASAKPDIMLSDIGMPGEDGYALIRKVRALPRDQGGDIPAAALTAYTRAEDRRRMLSAGYSIHLAKPIDPAELVAATVALTRFVRHSDFARERG